MSRLLLPAAVVAIAAALAYWLLKGPEAGPADAPAPTAPPKPASAPGPNPTTSTPTPRVTVERGTAAPEDAPPSTLKQRADAGDVQASCRYAYLLSQCQLARTLERGVLEQRRRIAGREASPASEAMNAELERRAAEYAPMLRTCETLPAGEQREAWRYLLRAAQSGHLPSIVRFVSGLGLDRASTPLDAADQWLAYRQYVPGLLERAVAAGDLQAYALAAQHYAHMSPLGESPVTRDLVRALAFRLALARTSDTRVIQEATAKTWALQSGLDASQVAAAEVMADTLVAKADRSAPPAGGAASCESAATTASGRSPPPRSP